MPLPAGFKVNGLSSFSSIPVPPQVHRIMAMLDKLPENEVLTTREMAQRVGTANSNASFQHPVLMDYKQRVDNKMFWGSRASIAQLRKSLSEGEENNA